MYTCHDNFKDHFVVLCALKASTDIHLKQPGLKMNLANLIANLFSPFPMDVSYPLLVVPGINISSNVKFA